MAVFPVKFHNEIVCSLLRILPLSSFSKLSLMMQLLKYSAIFHYACFNAPIRSTCGSAHINHRVYTMQLYTSTHRVYTCSLYTSTHRVYTCSLYTSTHRVHTCSLYTSTHRVHTCSLYTSTHRVYTCSYIPPLIECTHAAIYLHS